MNVYVISLKNEYARKKRIETQLNSKIDFQFFEAYEGKTVPEYLHKIINDKYRITWRGKAPLTPGERGCYVSHLMLWIKCVELNEPIVVLEDDVKIGLNFTLDVLEKIAKSGHMFVRLEASTDGEAKRKYIHLNDTYSYLLDNRIGARGYFITPEAAFKLINGSSTIKEAVDNYIGEAWIHGVPTTILNEPIVFNQEGEFETSIKGRGQGKPPFIFKVLSEINRFYRNLRLKLFNFSELKPRLFK
jgi:glycosyl transferase family 25